MSHSRMILSRSIHITFSSLLAIACMLTACDDDYDDLDDVEELSAELGPANESVPKYVLKGTDKQEIMVELETQAALYSEEEHPAEEAMLCGNTGGCDWCGGSGCVAWICDDGNSGVCCFDKHGDCRNE